MIARTAVITALCVTALPAAARVADDRVDLLVSLICDNGGAMETSDAAKILPPHGYTMDETQAIVAELEKRGQVVPTAGIATLQLTESACK
ncbi:MAG: hypothetical protein AAFN94_10905 [Pseudomonadota bacterium]